MTIDALPFVYGRGALGAVCFAPVVATGCVLVLVLVTWGERRGERVRSGVVALSSGVVVSLWLVTMALMLASVS